MDSPWELAVTQYRVIGVLSILQKNAAMTELINSIVTVASKLQPIKLTPLTDVLEISSSHVPGAYLNWWSAPHG